MTLEGTNFDGSPYVKRIWEGNATATNPTWVNQGFFTASAPISELRGLRDGSELRIIFKVGLKNSGNPEANAMTFAARIYAVKADQDIRP